jgi:DNA replication protein DnaC
MRRRWRQGCQIPVDRWHDLIGDPTFADAVLDRIIHNAHRIKLRGDSLRKKAAATLDQTPVP